MSEGQSWCKVTQVNARECRQMVWVTMCEKTPEILGGACGANAAKDRQLELNAGTAVINDMRRKHVFLASLH